MTFGFMDKQRDNCSVFSTTAPPAIVCRCVTNSSLRTDLPSAWSRMEGLLPVVKWISYGPPKAGFQVQFLTGGPVKKPPYGGFFLPILSLMACRKHRCGPCFFQLTFDIFLPFFYQDSGSSKWISVDKNRRKLMILNKKPLPITPEYCLRRPILYPLSYSRTFQIWIISRLHLHLSVLQDL